MLSTPMSAGTKRLYLYRHGGAAPEKPVSEELERYSIIRTVSAVERADVVILVIDAVEGVTEQDAKIAGIAHDRGKGIIIAVNKWDAVEKNDKTVKEYSERIRSVLSFHALRGNPVCVRGDGARDCPGFLIP